MLFHTLCRDLRFAKPQWMNPGRHLQDSMKRIDEEETPVET